MLGYGWLAGSGRGEERGESWCEEIRERVKVDGSINEGGKAPADAYARNTEEVRGAGGGNSRVQRRAVQLDAARSILQNSGIIVFDAGDGTGSEKAMVDWKSNVRGAAGTVDTIERVALPAWLHEKRQRAGQRIASIVLAHEVEC